MVVGKKSKKKMKQPEIVLVAEELIKQTECGICLLELSDPCVNKKCKCKVFYCRNCIDEWVGIREGGCVYCNQSIHPNDIISVTIQ